MTNSASDVSSNWDLSESDTEDLKEPSDSWRWTELQSKIDWSGLLRTMGAMTVVAGMCAYLMQNLGDWQGISRYYVMLVGSLILAAGGFATSFLLKENKGARVFFGLALICTMVTTTTLGGFVNAAVNREAALLTDLNAGGMFGIDWFIADTMTLLGMGLSALLVLLPIAWFSFKILNRPHANTLLACFAACGALLLIPLRESLPVGILILCAVAMPFYLLYRKLPGDLHFKTWEGKFSAAVLFAPALIMMGRLLWLYQVDVLIGWMLTAIVLTASLLVSRNAEERNLWLGLNLVVALAASALLAFLSIDLLRAMLPLLLMVPLGGALFAGLCQLIAWQGLQKFPSIGLFGYVVAAVLTLLNATALGSLGGWTLCILLGSTLVLIARHGTKGGSTSLQWLGKVTLAIGIFPWLFELPTVVDLTNWISLAVIGVSAIVIASVLERAKRKPVQ